MTSVRRGHLALACGSLLTTVLVAASATGLLPSPGPGPGAAVAVADETLALPGVVVEHAAADTSAAEDGAPGAWDGARLGATVQPALVVAPDEPAALVDPPAGSGRGRRVVFDERSQHVWLVDEGGAVTRHYPVSGSVADNLDPGTYEVYSRSRHATSFNLSSTMEYMVRFTQGEEAAIGFHAIPVDAQGRRLQGFAELGTPQSHGCIRQRRADALALWRFADVGTAVVVV